MFLHRRTVNGKNGSKRRNGYMAVSPDIPENIFSYLRKLFRRKDPAFHVPQTGFKESVPGKIFSVRSGRNSCNGFEKLVKIGMGTKVADPDNIFDGIIFILQKPAGKMDLAVGKVSKKIVSGKTFKLPLETPCGKGTFFRKFRNIVIVPGGTLHF